MTKIEATASIFLTAFRSLTKTERRAVAEHLLTDESLARDIMDIALINRRRREPSRTLDSYLKEKRVPRQIKAVR